jgi:hypothetical protein
MASQHIDLSNPAKIGAELLKDPKGDFPLDVWETYCLQAVAHLGLGPLYPEFVSVLSWRRDPSDPKTSALDPQEAVDEARTWAIKTALLLKMNQPAKALESAEQAVNILVRGASFSQPCVPSRTRK